MSCINGKKHELDYDPIERNYKCKYCTIKYEFLEDPKEFIRILKDMNQYIAEFGRLYDYNEAMIPLLKWLINLKLLWEKIAK